MGGEGELWIQDSLGSSVTYPKERSKEKQKKKLRMWGDAYRNWNICMSAVHRSNRETSVSSHGTMNSTMSKKGTVDIV